MDGDRLQFDPEVPTLVEQGFPYKIQRIFYLFGPQRLPAAAAARLVDAFGKTARTTRYLEVTKRNRIVSNNPNANENLERFILEDRTRTGAMVNKLGLRKQ